VYAFGFNNRSCRMIADKMQILKYWIRRRSIAMCVYIIGLSVREGEP
jgi:hypothetical protein